MKDKGLYSRTANECDHWFIYVLRCLLFPAPVSDYVTYSSKLPR